MKRRGFTLAELVIVIALSSVVLLAVTAMMLSISGYSHTRSEELEAKSEIGILESRLTEWFSSLDASGTHAPQVTDSGHGVYFATAGTAGTIISAVFNPDAGTVTLDDRSGGEQTVSCSHLSDVTFSKSDAADPGLVRCTVAYSVNGESRTYTFLLLKRSENAV